MPKFESPLYYKNFASLQRKVALELANEIIASEGHECKILDIGCGTGFLGEALRERGFTGEIWGVDGSAEMLSLVNPSIYTGSRVLKITPETALPQGFTYASSMFTQWLEEPIKTGEIREKFYFAQPIEGSLQEALEAFQKTSLESPFLPFKTTFKPSYIKEYIEEWPNLLSFLKHLNKIGAKNTSSSLALSHKNFRDLEPHFTGKITWQIGFFKSLPDHPQSRP